MFPGKCVVCEGPTGLFYLLQKGKDLKKEVCPKCKDKLEKEGWKVVTKALH